GLAALAGRVGERAAGLPLRPDPRRKRDGGGWRGPIGYDGGRGELDGGPSTELRDHGPGGRCVRGGMTTRRVTSPGAGMYWVASSAVGHCGCWVGCWVGS